MVPTVVIRSPIGCGGTGVLALVAAVTIIQTARVASPLDALELAVYPLLIVVIAWALWGRPAVVFRPAVVKLVNPLRTITISYRDITDVTARGALRIHVGTRHYTAWAAPARGGYLATMGREIPVPELDGDSEEVKVNLDAAAAAQLLRLQLETRARQATSQPVAIRLNFDVVIPLLVLLIALVIPLL